MKFWTTVCAVALLAACSGNNETGNNAADSGPDSAIGTDSGPSTDMASGADTNPDPADMSSDMNVPTDMTLPEDMGPDMTDPPDVAMQNCAHPTTDPTCPMGEFGAGTFLNTIEIVEDATCCRDFTGDGNPDNKIGEFLTLLAGTGEDANANIATAIGAGALSYLIEYSNWTSEVYDADLDFRVYLGADTDNDFTDNLAGTGAFNIKPESFDQNGDPKWNFEDVTVNNGHMVARGGTLELFFPGLLDEVQMLMNDVRIEADVIAPADLASGGGATLENGEISGALDRALFYDSMNEAANACGCIGKNAFAYDAGVDKYQCELDMADQMNCDNDPGAASGCRFLANRTACQFFELVSDRVDVDVDGNGENESFSVGIRFTGIPGEVAGRQ